MIEKGVLLAEGPKLELENLGLETANNGNGHDGDKNLPTIPSDGIDFPSILEAIEKDYIEEALKLANGNESKAVHLLNMSRDKFRYRRQKLSV